MSALTRWLLGAVLLTAAAWGVLEWRGAVEDARAADARLAAAKDTLSRVREARQRADSVRATLQRDLDRERALRVADAASAAADALDAEAEARAAETATEAAGDSLNVVLDSLFVRAPVELMPWVDAAREIHDRERAASRATAAGLRAANAALRSQVDALESVVTIADSTSSLLRARNAGLMAELAAESAARVAAEAARDEWREAAGVGFLGHIEKYGAGAAAGAALACMFLCG